ncbi:MAG: patatin-like phospholipase family protein [Spirochaetota bacterium]
MVFFSRITDKIQTLFPPNEISFALAGGGCKALYALGVGYRIRSWGLKIKEISGVSAGSAMALMILSEAEELSIEYFEELLKRNNSNFKLWNLITGKRPWPHESMYRRTIRYGIDFEKIGRSGVRIFIATVKAFPRKNIWKNYWNKLQLIPPTMRAFILDELDKEQGKPCNRVDKIVKKWKLKEIVFTNEDFKYPEVTEQIIMNSSSVPPILSFQNINNEYYLDGSLTNNLLLEKFTPGRKKLAVYYDNTTLIGKDPSVLQETYFIKPKRKLPIEKFDYTNATGARLAYEMGKEDAETHKNKIFSFLGLA